MWTDDTKCLPIFSCDSNGLVQQNDKIFFVFCQLWFVLNIFPSFLCLCQKVAMFSGEWIGESEDIVMRFISQFEVERRTTATTNAQPAQQVASGNAAMSEVPLALELLEYECHNGVLVLHRKPTSTPADPNSRPEASQTVERFNIVEHSPVALVLQRIAADGARVGEPLCLMPNSSKENSLENAAEPHDDDSGVDLGMELCVTGKHITIHEEGSEEREEGETAAQKK